MRTLLHTRLSAGLAASPLRGAEAQPRIYQVGSLGVGAVPADPVKPFMTIRQMPSTRYREVRDTSRANRQTWQIYCYDTRGSLLRIDSIMQLAEPIVESLEGLQSPTGAWCFEALWLGISQDFGDDNYDAVARYATVQLSSNK